jgi:hypothetical protein
MNIRASVQFLFGSKIWIKHGLEKSDLDKACPTCIIKRFYTCQNRTNILIQKEIHTIIEIIESS